MISYTTNASTRRDFNLNLDEIRNIGTDVIRYFFLCRSRKTAVHSAFHTCHVVAYFCILCQRCDSGFFALFKVYAYFEIYSFNIPMDI